MSKMLTVMGGSQQNLGNNQRRRTPGSDQSRGERGMIRHIYGTLRGPVPGAWERLKGAQGEAVANKSTENQ